MKNHNDVDIKAGALTRFLRQDESAGVWLTINWTRQMSPDGRLAVTGEVTLAYGERVVWEPDEKSVK